METRYPIYIVSKGRADTRLTSKALEESDVPYYIVVEPQEYADYAAVIEPSKILQLPFSNLGQGSIPARNWIWDHAISTGARRHWIMDDNIHGFRRYVRNRRLRCTDGSVLREAEEYTDRWANVALSGLQYSGFANPGITRAFNKPFMLNTRIYSCILIDNAVPFRWRGRYNEDTDLSIRVLKAGYCTILFLWYLINKAETMTMRGGNTDQLYQQTDAFDGRYEMAKSLFLQHPDCVKIGRRWGRYQHVTDLRRWKHNQLIPVDQSSQ